MNCPKCGSEMYDNRATKQNPKQPDYKCKRYKEGCDGAIWPPKGSAAPQRPIREVLDAEEPLPVVKKPETTLAADMAEQFNAIGIALLHLGRLKNDEALKGEDFLQNVLTTATFADIKAIAATVTINRAKGK